VRRTGANAVTRQQRSHVHDGHGIAFARRHV
jgi:hypothetical protein